MRNTGFATTVWVASSVAVSVAPGVAEASPVDVAAGETGVWACVEEAIRWTQTRTSMGAAATNSRSPDLRIMIATWSGRLLVIPRATVEETTHLALGFIVSQQLVKQRPVGRRQLLPARPEL